MNWADDGEEGATGGRDEIRLLILADEWEERRRQRKGDGDRCRADRIRCRIALQLTITTHSHIHIYRRTHNHHPHRKKGTRKERRGGRREGRSYVRRK